MSTPHSAICVFFEDDYNECDWTTYTLEEPLIEIPAYMNAVITMILRLRKTQLPTNCMGDQAWAFEC